MHTETHNATIHQLPLDHTQAHGCVGMLQDQLSSVEELTNELKRLLVRHEAALDEEGIRQQVETLERWMESYRRGLAAAAKVSEHGPCWLNELKNRLQLAADELHRLEAEGGNPPSRDQAAQAEEFLKASRRIDKVLPAFEQIFAARPADMENV